MRKKYLNSILFILLVVIYAGVFFKIFGKKETQSNSNITSFIGSNSFALDLKREEFDINGISQDPFRLSIKPHSKSSQNTLNNQSKKKSNKPITKRENSWPQINYYGFVRNNLNATKLALLKVDNIMHRKREKEKIGAILILEAYNDSIILKKGGFIKTIKRIKK
jgi:hypothetical protein